MIVHYSDYFVNYLIAKISNLFQLLFITVELSVDAVTATQDYILSNPITILLLFKQVICKWKPILFSPFQC